MKIGYKGISNYYRVGIIDVFNVFKDNLNDYIFIDVRNPNEWEKGIIPKALRISFDDFESKIKDLDKFQNYIMVCHYGGRSSLACEIMISNGFKNIYNFQGGMLDWYYNDYPLSFISN